MTPSPAQTIWARCLDSVAQELPPQAIKTWFEPLKPVSLREGEEDLELCLQLPSQFYQEWIAQHYGPLLSSSLSSVTGQPVRVTFTVSTESTLDTKHTDDAGTETHGANRRNIPAITHRPREHNASPILRHSAPPVPRAASSVDLHIATSLNPKYTFDTFIEGACNRLARSASIAIAERPGKTSFNPFLIYGGVGLGKTHLAQAIGNFIQTHRTLERIRYVSSEQFTTEFVQAIQRNRAMEFTNFYRQMDLLIVDDIQFFGGKEKTQEEFFHIFNDLHQRGKQVILCADRPPREISGIEERLLSRFQWGLTADVQMPDLETRIAILNRKAEAEGVAVPMDVVEFIAERVTSNVRELEGSLIRLIAHARLQRRPINLELAQETLRGLIREQPVRLEISDIQRIVAEFYGIDVRQLLGSSRKREIVSARHVAMYFCKQNTQSTLKTIGGSFGGRDHSTVIHACTAVEDRIDTDPAFREEFARVSQRVKYAAK